MFERAHLQAFVEHLRHEHRELHDALEHVREGLDGVSNSPQSWPDVTALLDRLHALRDRLQRHFTEEESGGCLDEAAARRPAIAAQVAVTIGKHADLLHDLDRVIQRVQLAGQAAGTWKLAREGFTDFVQRLYQHEREESRLLQSGLNMNLELENDPIEVNEGMGKLAGQRPPR